MNTLLKKTVGRICPTYAIFPLVGSFVVETLVYEVSKLLEKGRYHYDFTTSFDRAVPVIPWFSFIYFGCYIFWVLNFILLTRVSKEHLYRMLFAVYLSYMINAIIFIAMPTTNIRPEVTGNSISEQVLRFIYWSDTAENLFPSIHCSVSWFCYIGIRRKKQIPKAYRIFSMLFALVVVVSTQVTKQHYFVDAIGGIALAEICCLISYKTKLYQPFQRFFEKLNTRCGLD
ncbi:phosphatase PAP2 family protein [Anaerosporobacter faecicola]|uniref:phosphatase PAP2 family protein n=1 Tax=Anaerosporobacter faecicola TaxID=2718714 RepID=UPI0014398997|nr:phosphatase PAP2 family protein [Anaerosporobacter faecicola]